MKGRMLVLLAVFSVLFMMMPVVSARHKNESKVDKILYVPLDNRPIADKQTTEAIQKLGYQVVVPPENMLGDRQNLGNPDELWTWMEKNAPDADAAVVSSDSMLYGSLVGSRKHEYSKQEILSRAEKFQTFRKEFPKLPLYVFSSIMRTPRSGEASGHEEPAYYRSYGSDIFRYTLLRDKAEVEGLTRREKKEQAFLEQLIPENDLADWLGRREKNFAANKTLISMTRANVFNYLALGRDDNAPYSQTHLESRHLAEAGSDLDVSRFQTMAGIDELGMLLLTRAVNTIRHETPFIYVRYNWGQGEFTVPAYSDEKISASIRSAVAAAGAIEIKAPEQADLVLVVNTNPNGRTYEANDRANDGTPREGTKYLADIITDYTSKGYPVALADIAYANGADNALMEELKKRGLLFRLRAYAGWNTPTNSTGFVLGEGLLTKHMRDDDVDQLLLTRYLDDWAYQANVRTIIARQLTWLRGDGVYGSLDTKKDAVAERSANMITRFAETNFPPFKSLEEIQVAFPWNRLFEADIQHQEHQEIHYFQRDTK